MDPHGGITRDALSVRSNSVTMLCGLQRYVFVFLLREFSGENPS